LVHLSDNDDWGATLPETSAEVKWLDSGVDGMPPIGLGTARKDERFNLC